MSKTVITIEFYPEDDSESIQVQSGYIPLTEGEHDWLENPAPVISLARLQAIIEFMHPVLEGKRELTLTDLQIPDVDGLVIH